LSGTVAVHSHGVVGESLLTEPNPHVRRKMFPQHTIHGLWVFERHEYGAPPRLEGEKLNIDTNK
jgi:hypothetical protein